MTYYPLRLWRTYGEEQHGMCSRGKGIHRQYP